MDSASRKRPFSTGLFFDWILLVVHLIVSRVDLIIDLPRGGWCEGVLLYGARKSVGSCVLRAFFASNACFTRDEASSKRVGGVGLRRKPRCFDSRDPLSAPPLPKRTDPLHPSPCRRSRSFSSFGAAWLKLCRCRQRHLACFLFEVVVHYERVANTSSSILSCLFGAHISPPTKLCSEHQEQPPPAMSNRA